MLRFGAMTTALAKKRVSYAEYVAMEVRAGERLEFVDGWVYAMVGGTPTHARLASRVLAALAAALRPPCEPYGSDLKIHIAAAHRSTYADVVVVCGEPQTARGDKNAIVNPVVLVEVLSPSTEGEDRGAKWSDYQTLASLQHYVLVSQDVRRVEVYSRQAEGWRYVDRRQRGLVTLEAVCASLSLDAIYRGIALTKRPARR